jgi:hypothetical protein
MGAKAHAVAACAPYMLALMSTKVHVVVDLHERFVLQVGRQRIGIRRDECPGKCCCGWLAVRGDKTQMPPASSTPESLTVAEVNCCSTAHSVKRDESDRKMGSVGNCKSRVALRSTT